MGLRVVLRYAQAFDVHETEAKLSGGAALIGAAAIPFDGLEIILANAKTTLLIDVAKVLRVSEKAVPFHRFGIVLRHTLTVPINSGEIFSGEGVALIGR